MKAIVFRLLFTVILFSLCCNISYAQNKPVITSIKGKLVRVTPRLDKIDGKSMYGAPLAITRYKEGFAGGITDPEEAEEAIFKNVPSSKSTGTKDASTLSTNSPSASAPTSTINLNMDGQTFPNFAPSDNNMAVGPNDIIQITNNSSGSAFKIWDKSGTVLKSSTVLSTITGVTGVGDPVVLYDQLADRWVLTEFGKTGNVRYINTLVIAVSQTSDPTGSWYVYSYVVSNNGTSYFVDYPKYAIWNNAYYATSNDFNTAGTSYLGSSIYAFDRNAMLSGASTATMVRTRLSGSGSRYYSMAPVCQEGATNSNQSGLFAFLQDDAWVSAPKDSIFVFEFTPNFANPASSVVGPFNAMATTLPFNTNTGNLSQPGTSQTIQSLSQRLMHKVIYRNFGTYESIVCNTTDLENGRTGVHWWEFRRPESGNWSIYQEGLWQPTSDNNNRFMGSIAINGNGDIGLLYNVVSSSVYPSARFTGRSSCDPLGQMTLPETVVKDGTTYESNNRYGDYNSLSVDPSNGSFWGSAQYNAPGYGTYGNWVTRIVNFTLSSSCSTANAGTVTGTSPLCIGQITTYSSNGDTAGTWSSTNTSVATVNASTGVVTALSAGTTNITYTVNGASSYQALTVNPNVNAGTISGPSSVCVGGTITLTTNGDAGGTWSSDNTNVATVNASNGIVTGVSTGTANITYTISSGCGAPKSASLQISVTSCSSPTISCPGSITTSAISGCSVSVSVPDPTITNTTTLTWTMSGATTGSSPASGINYVGTAAFNVGTTTVTYTASNGGGVSANCSFTVTVTDNTPATITCPSNVVVTVNGNGRCNASVNVPNPTTSSNCSVTTLTWVMSGATTGNSGSTGINYVGTQTFPVGVTTITYTLTNGANNTVTCSFTVTVKNKKCPNSPAAPTTTNGNTTATTLMDLGDQLNVTVFPNPSETYFTMLVHSASTENVEVSVFSINGKLVQKLKGSVYNTFRFGDNYTAGTYIVKVQQGYKQSIVKVVK